MKSTDGFNQITSMMDTPQKRGGEAGKGKSRHYYEDPLYMGQFHYADPRLDWAPLRRLKMETCPNCQHYDDLLGGCEFGWSLKEPVCPL